MQFVSRPFVVGDRIDITSSGGAKFATGVVEQVGPSSTPCCLSHSWGSLGSAHVLCSAASTLAWRTL